MYSNLLAINLIKRDAICIYDRQMAIIETSAAWNRIISVSISNVWLIVELLRLNINPDQNMKSGLLLKIHFKSA